MRTLARVVGLLSLVAAASIAVAQGPGRPPMAGGGPGPGMMPGGPGGGGGSPIGATADFLLAHTGDLALTDAQVIRLAAISRRTDARRKTMMARLDSARTAAPAPGDSARRGRRPTPPAPQAMQQMRDQMHNDLRDAIAVLTPDQQASAWMMVAARSALGGPGGPMMGARFGRGPAPDGAQRNQRGPISRPPAPRDVPRRPNSDGSDRTEP